ncbi:MAG TPA: gamma carbonic anhydrase family protein [Myxococcota bacterium]|nr:gamma carbonic anhydrase family protein [Myxococcota bacterium]
MESLQSIHGSVWIAPGVQIYGRVTIGAHASLWPHAVIRAEAQEVRIGRMTNIQDFAMLHVGYDARTVIGDFCSITHRATVHGCTIGDHCLIGIGATIMDGAVIGKGSIVGGGALVPEGKVFPPGSILVGVPARVIATRDASRENRLNAWQYQRNASHYARGLHRAWDGPEYRAWIAAKRAEVEADRDLEVEP